MTKTIWTCWFQGRENAPRVIKSCLASWERNNPNWDFRCLDASSIERYVPIRQYLDLNKQTLTAASLSDFVRILLLAEFGGVWVDASLFCNRPLDEWLPDLLQERFFAFAEPAPDRPLSSWFLAAEPTSYLISSWRRRAVEYWSRRTATDDYYWFHHIFRAMLVADGRAAQAWSKVPRISATGPHALQFGGRMYRDRREVEQEINWETPVFKLTYRLADDRLPRGSILECLMQKEKTAWDSPKPAPAPPITTAKCDPPKKFAALKVATENLGDHIQIISGLRMLARLGVEPTHFVDRDDEIKSAPALEDAEGCVGIILNGWFKTNRREWPPHPKLAPLILGFHIRPFQCPELLSDASMEFFRRHQPIGCRDIYTEELLRTKGVDAFTSHCLSLTLPRRMENPDMQSEIFVVSRDQRILSHIPRSLAPVTFVSHYTGSGDFASNMARAEQLLHTYRSRAKLIVTTLLHCALPAIAMGIPVVVFYPINNQAGHASDRERFSSIEQLTRVYRFDEIEAINWNPAPIDVSAIKLQLWDRFYQMAARWRIASAPLLGPIAPASALPVPD